MHRKLSIPAPFVLLISCTLWGEPAIHLKTRLLETHPGESALYQSAPRNRGAGASHWLVQFSRAPEAGELQSLENKGFKIIGYVPENAFVVEAPEPPVTGGGVRWTGVLDKLDKISPKLENLQSSEGSHFFLVEAWPGVDMEVVKTLVEELGLERLVNPFLLPNQLLVRGRMEQVLRLVEWDEISYVFPASEDLAEGYPVVACSGAANPFGWMGQYVARFGEGWDGPGRGAAKLSYFFQQLQSKLARESQETEIRRALGEWSRQAQIDFAPASSGDGPRTLNFLFASGYHQDPYPFDGPGKVLGHTFYPAPPNPEPIAGDLHFDDAEDWHIGADMDLYSVVLHELGHALGLGHSDKPGAVMYPYYRQSGELTQEDIGALREMYAAREASPEAPPSAPAPSTPPATPPPMPGTPQPPQPSPKKDTTPPVLSITSPAGAAVATSLITITVRGRATDNTGVAEVVWSSSSGASGRAEGIDPWTCASIPLLKGANTITIRARDAAGNSAWRSIMVTRR